MNPYLRPIIYVLPVIVVAIVLRLVLNKAARKSAEAQAESNILRLPLLFRIIPFIVAAFLISVYIIIIIQNIEDWPFIIIFAIFFIPALIAAIMWSLWKVEIRDEDFVYRNWFGKIKVYRYEDLELRCHPKGLKWFFYQGDKKVFTMAYFIENGDKLAAAYEAKLGEV
ncbi:MAG: hypothetical protein J1F36_05465 [Clostridiales bacterium]|nr:hypothetical protein [Clostridiales bacterium]